MWLDLALHRNVCCVIAYAISYNYKLRAAMFYIRNVKTNVIQTSKQFTLY